MDRTNVTGTFKLGLTKPPKIENGHHTMICKEVIHENWDMMVVELAAKYADVKEEI